MYLLHEDFVFVENGHSVNYSLPDGIFASEDPVEFLGGRFCFDGQEFTTMMMR